MREIRLSGSESGGGNPERTSRHRALPRLYPLPLLLRAKRAEGYKG